MVKSTGKYLLATGKDTDWTSVLSNWDLTFSRLNTVIFDVSGLPLVNDVSLNTTNFISIDISMNAPQLLPFRAYWLDISGLIMNNTKFYMTEDESYIINNIYIDAILGNTSYNLDICGNHIKTITMAQTVTSIADEAFSGLPNLTRVNIPKTVTTIGSGTFEDCSNLSTVTFESSSSLNSIGASAFSGASDLTFITIPQGVTSVGDNAFYDCSGLVDVVFTGNMIPSDISNNTFPPKSQGITAYYTQTLSQNYIDILTYTFLYVVGPATVFTLIDYTTKSINISGSFTKSSYISDISLNNIMSVTFGSTVTSIGESAFYNCSSLLGVTIYKNVNSIGTNAFLGSGLKNVDMTQSTSNQLRLPPWYNYTTSPSTGPNGEETEVVAQKYGLYNYTFFGATGVNIYQESGIVL